MVADGRPRSDQAAQACRTCKTRKKRCNKSLPSCGYCIRKKLNCSYGSAPPCKNTNPAPSWSTRPPLDAVSSRITLAPELSSVQGEAEAHWLVTPFKFLGRHPHALTREASNSLEIYLQVHGIIRGTGQFVDDISTRYFCGFHRHLPVISRTQFNSNLIGERATPAPDFSVLLLTICLITSAPALGYHFGQTATRSAGQNSLYLTARSLFAQVQVSCSPSISLVQAGILLSIYEYIQGRSDDAFMTLSGAARMAYTIRIHTQQEQTARASGYYANIDLLQQAEEAANTWWGIVICERIFYTEVTALDQPLLTTFPYGHSRLPLDPNVFDNLDILDVAAVPNIPLSCLTSPKIGGFSRTAQATCLLDQVFKSIATPDIDSRLLQLDRLDTNIQAFLSLVMPQCQGQSGIFCESMNIAIRALFTLHWHILGQRGQIVRANFTSLDEWHKRSQDALDTVTKMVIDIAHSLVTPSPTNTETQLIDGMSPMYPYIARAALRHMQKNIQGKDVDWMTSAHNTVETSLNKYLQRWGVARNQL